MKSEIKKQVPSLCTSCKRAASALLLTSVCLLPLSLVAMQDSCNKQMSLHSIHALFFFISLFLHQLIFSVADHLSSPYSPLENIILNCGSSGNLTAKNGREWIGDSDHSKFTSSQQLNDSSKASTALHQAASIDPVPFMSARIFLSQFTYTFQVSPGQKFIRLYFYPVSYHGFERSKALFSVKAGSFTLLGNFNASLVADSLGLDSLVKEFCVNAEDNQELSITFIPSSTSGDAYAFINGIEIVSMPTNLYYTRSGGNGVSLVGHNSTALETVHRLNVGGSSVLPEKDSGMFRAWIEDTKFLLRGGVASVNMTTRIKFTERPAYTAPAEVYQTARSMGRDKEANKHYNLTWELPVDSGFNYLVRLHFCEFQSEITKVGDRVFHIFIENQTAEAYADVIQWSGGNGIPVYKDYVVMMQSEKIGSNLFIALHPSSDSRTRYSDAILNGIEVFKLSNSDHDRAAGSNPEPVLTTAPIKASCQQAKTSRIMKALLIAFGGLIISGLILISLLVFVVFHLCTTAKPRMVKATSLLPEGICRKFTFAEIRTATNNFDKALVIGNGGFGRVYKGYINGGQSPVAIKRLMPRSEQGAREFQTEIEMLSRLRHVHLVSLIGYCNDKRQMILVYDYMARGTLRDHLYRTDNPPLPWKKRLEICIGAARGLEYLHAGLEHSIIHRDIKSTNILLDENWVAKVSDFGLSKMGPTSMSRSHVSTDAKGTFGYLDPEYYWSNKLTVKSDVYSLGVVMFEVLCARPAVDMGLEEEQHSLALWASYCVKHGTIDQIIDPCLTGKIAPQCLKVFAKLAEKCLRDHKKERPKIADVVRRLEDALKLQENADAAKEAVKTEGTLRLQIDVENGRRNKLGSGSPKIGGLINSCPTFWQSSISHKALLRLFSDKAGLKWANSPKFCGLNKLCFTNSPVKYDSLPRDHEIVTDSSVSVVCVTALNRSIEKSEGEICQVEDA